MPWFGDDEMTAKAVETDLSEQQFERINNLMQERKEGVK
jgi:hypothetical protein